jgi:hypothetical protein
VVVVSPVIFIAPPVRKTLIHAGEESPDADRAVVIVTADNA